MNNESIKEIKVQDICVHVRVRYPTICFVSVKLTSSSCSYKWGHYNNSLDISATCVQVSKEHQVGYMNQGGALIHEK